MVGETVEKKLYNAASKGDVAILKQLLQEEPYLVETVSFACSRNVVHLATLRGQVAIVEEVLNINPQLARNLDSQQSSPLHIAAAQGSLEIVKKLLSVAPEACWWRDCHDMNPIHIAAMNGHVHILEELLEESPLPAMERLHHGQTVFHLCVKHGQLTTLKVLVEKLGELEDAKDDDGKTLLHLAARSNQHAIVDYLVEHKIIKKQAPNSMGPQWVKLTDNAMVVLILLASMAFQVAVSPPGGVWQDNNDGHKAGQAIMRSTHPRRHNLFLIWNTIAFVASLTTIFLIMTGLPSRNIHFFAHAVLGMWGSIVFIVGSYAVSMMTTSSGVLSFAVSFLTFFACVFGPVIYYYINRRWIYHLGRD